MRHALVLIGVLILTLPCFAQVYESKDSQENWKRFLPEPLGRQAPPILELQRRPRRRLLQPPPNAPISQDQGSTIAFDEKLSEEIRRKYREKFGASEVEQMHSLPQTRGVYEPNMGFVHRVEEEGDEQMRFGNYVMRRLFEHHVDQSLKKDPRLRPIQETKERLSQTQVSFSRRSKLSTRYSISGSYLDLVWLNPWSKMTLTQETGSEPETILYIERDVTPRVVVQSYYRVVEDVTRVTGKYRWSRQVTLSLSGGTYTHEYEDGDRTSRASLVMAGFHWSY